MPEVTTTAATSQGDCISTAFRQAMRRLATTVTIITATDHQGGPVGMTATAVTSVTNDPPALLICVNRSASIHPSLGPAARFCVNLLRQGQEQLSHTFGGALPPEQRFRLGRWDTDTAGTHFLVDAQANLFCTVDAAMDYGTHSIFVGRIARVLLNGDVAPLIYGDGRFLDLPRPQTSPPMPSPPCTL